MSQVFRTKSLSEKTLIFRHEVDVERLVSAWEGESER